MPEITIIEQSKPATLKVTNNMTEDRIQITPEKKLQTYNDADDNQVKEENIIKEVVVKAAEFLGIDQFELLLYRAW